MSQCVAKCCSVLKSVYSVVTGSRSLKFVAPSSIVARSLYREKFCQVSIYREREREREREMRFNP